MKICHFYLRSLNYFLFHSFYYFQFSTHIDFFISLQQKMDAKAERDAEKKSLAKQTSEIIFAVSLYWTVSISMVFVNKYLLSSPDLKFDAPLFVTWFQCVVSVGICGILAAIASQGYITYPPFKIDLKIAREVLPLSLIFVGMIAFNNLCLKHVSISFYMIVRSLTTVFNVVSVSQFYCNAFKVRNWRKETFFWKLK